MQRAFACLALAVLGVQHAKGLDRAGVSPQPEPGAATILHRADILRERSIQSSGPMRLWPLHSTPQARMNYLEVSGRSSLHFHPDADHKLYVLEGAVLITAG